MSINPAMYSSATDRHNTPRWLVEQIADFLGGIELDPCTDESNPCGAERFYTEATDGLAQPWQARSCYVNSPYGREIGLWQTKLVEEYQRGNVDEAITLVPARTDTKWWSGLAEYPACFLRGRLQFNDCGQSAPFPSALVYLGDNWQGFAKAFGELGIVYLPMAYVERIQDSYKVNA
jgi:phage N-6-adenine-methyltransferase